MKGSDGLSTLALDGGVYNSIALKTDGTIWAWGTNKFGESGNGYLTVASNYPVLVNIGITNAIAVSSGGWDSTYVAHTLALRSDGLVAAMGNNAYGQLGDGSGLNQTNFVLVTNLTSAVAVAAGGYHSVALKTDGTVWAWGTNNFGQTGSGTTNAIYTTPVQVTNLNDIVSVAAGLYHGLALKADGTVWAWGGNAGGQLGDGTITNRLAPVQVTNLNNIIAISAGGSNSLALRADGTVWAWGANKYGQIGNGTTTTPQTSPVQVTNLTGVIAIAAGGYHNLALKTDGTVWAWGRDDFGQLGNQTNTTAQTIPVSVANLTGALAIAAGEFHSLASLADGTIAAWGRNNAGQIGSSVAIGKTNNTASLVIGISGVGLAANKHTVMGKTDGTVWSFGENVFGQLGDGTTVNRLFPVNIIGLLNVVAVFGGSAHSAALRNDGSVWTWGYNEFGQLGDGTTINRQSPVAVANLNGITAIATGGRAYPGVAKYWNCVDMGCQYVWSIGCWKHG